MYKYRKDARTYGIDLQTRQRQIRTMILDTYNSVETLKHAIANIKIPDTSGLQEMMKWINLYNKFIEDNNIEYDYIAEKLNESAMDNYIQRADNEYFQFMNENTKAFDTPVKSWYPMIHFDKTNGGINYYETIKIRMLLMKIFQKKGFDIKFAQDLVFTFFVGLSLPSGFTIHKSETIALWRDNPSMRWREVIINWRGLENQRLTSMTLGYIPFGIGSAINNVISVILQEHTQRRYKIFENLAYKSNINDGLILANWDKIKRILNDYGY